MPVFDPRFEFYAITDQASSLGRDDFSIAQGLLAGGASCLQYRAKKVPASLQWQTALLLRRLTLDHGVPFIVNDRVDLALDCGADGVHLGQDDLPLASARRLARGMGREDFLVGRSTHSLDQALEADKEGADYIGYGPLYPTQTKENNVAAVGVDSLREIVDSISVPVVAIGGIKPAHLAEVARHGGLYCAMVTALSSAMQVDVATREALTAWRQAKQAAPRR